MSLTVRNYSPCDAKTLASLFYDSVHLSALGPYTRHQLNAWAPRPIDFDLWQLRLDLLHPFVAEQDGNVVGFMSLSPTGEIGLAYTHPDHQRCGVAQAIYSQLETVARRQGLKLLTVDASKLAKPFFLKQGFRTLSKNQVQRMGEVLENWSMDKHLD
ncbi:GNAT family N-acetyltransferase [Gallaecimonas mangrovi]|uniref:GNAT family N-acetyltransferase n=1 Tax=Gallaecimonas mangrovi TaxID=2291597 RepID=UPI000E20B1CA|nr:GNAT family N-acetyltransferase [Gallaecimonas mangrovi]